jgi:hypothetical protein
MFPDLACLTNPFGCAWTWLEGLPFLYVLLAGVVIGMILGSILGKVGVAAVLTLGAAFLIWRKVEAEPAYETGEPEKSAPVTPRRKTLREAFEEIRNK